MTAQTRRTAGRPTKSETAAIDNRVLEGARAVFCREGIAAASIEEIAVATGLTKHTIYRRYSGKYALLYALVSHDLAKLKELIESTFTNADPLADLRAAAWQLISYARGLDEYRFITFLNAECAYSAEMRQKRQQWLDQLVGMMEPFLLRAQDAGLLRREDPAEQCRILFDLLDGEIRRGGEEMVVNPPLLQKIFDYRWDVFIRAMRN